MYQLTINREFNTPLEKLYAAWSNAEIIKQWFAPGDMKVAEATADFKEGGAYRIVMQDTNEQHIVGGFYKKIVVNETLEFSWQWENSPVATYVTLTFTDLGAGRSALELVHTEFEDQEQCDKHKMGWIGCLNNLVPNLIFK